MLNELVVRIGKTDKEYKINWDSLPDAGKNYLANYGATQSLNDAISSCAAKFKDAEGERGWNDATADGLILARIEAIVNGTIGMRQGGSRDPLAREINNVLTNQYGASWTKKDATDKRDKISQIKLAENPNHQAIVDQAQSQVDFKETETDISDL